MRHHDYNDNFQWADTTDKQKEFPGVAGIEYSKPNAWHDMRFGDDEKYLTKYCTEVYSPEWQAAWKEKNWSGRMFQVPCMRKWSFPEKKAQCIDQSLKVAPMKGMKWGSNDSECETMREDTMRDLVKSDFDRFDKSPIVKQWFNRKTDAEQNAMTERLRCDESTDGNVGNPCTKYSLDNLDNIKHYNRLFNIYCNSGSMESANCQKLKSALYGLSGKGSTELNKLDFAEKEFNYCKSKGFANEYCKRIGSNLREDNDAWLGLKRKYDEIWKNFCKTASHDPACACYKEDIFAIQMRDAEGIADPTLRKAAIDKIAEIKRTTPYIPPQCINYSCSTTHDNPEVYKFEKHRDFHPGSCPSVCVATINLIAGGLLKAENIQIVQACGQNSGQIQKQVVAKLLSDMGQLIAVLVQMCIYSGLAVPGPFQEMNFTELGAGMGDWKKWRAQYEVSRNNVFNIGYPPSVALWKTIDDMLNIIQAVTIAIAPIYKEIISLDFSKVGTPGGMNEAKYKDLTKQFAEKIAGFREGTVPLINARIFEAGQLSEKFIALRKGAAQKIANDPRINDINSKFEGKKKELMGIDQKKMTVADYQFIINSKLILPNAEQIAKEILIARDEKMIEEFLAKFESQVIKLVADYNIIIKEFDNIFLRITTPNFAAKMLEFAQSVSAKINAMPESDAKLKLRKELDIIKIPDQLSGAEFNLLHAKVADIESRIPIRPKDPPKIEPPANGGSWTTWIIILIIMFILIIAGGGSLVYFSRKKESI